MKSNVRGIWWQSLHGSFNEKNIKGHNHPLTRDFSASCTTENCYSFNNLLNIYFLLPSFRTVNGLLTIQRPCRTATTTAVTTTRSRWTTGTRRYRTSTHPWTSCSPTTRPPRSTTWSRRRGCAGPTTTRTRPNGRCC